MKLKNLAVCASILFGLMSYSGSANALSLDKEFKLNRRIYGGGIEQRVTPSFGNSFLTLIEKESYAEGDISEGYKNLTPEPKCFKRDEFLWDESSMRWAENVQHTSRSKKLDEIYRGMASIMVKVPGILDSKSEKENCGKFLWVPGMGIQVLLKDFSSQLSNGSPDENDRTEGVKTHATWTLSSDWRYYFEPNLYAGLLFTHKSFDRFTDDVDVDKFMEDNPGAGIDDGEDLNILSYQIAYKSSSSPFNYQIRGLWNIWQTAPHPIWIVRSHVDKDFRLNYKNHLSTDGRINYQISQEPVNFGFYTEFQVEFPNLIKYGHAKIPTDVSFGFDLGKFHIFYEVSRGRPNNWIVPGLYRTESDNKKTFGLGFRTN